MKSAFLAIISSALIIQANAQLEVTTKSFDLEPLNKQKNWRVIEGGRTNDNQIYLKLAKPACDMKSNAWTGDKTFKGLSWEIDKLYFSPTFEYQKTEPHKYATSEEAVQQNENVFGNTFMPLPNKIMGVAMPSQRLNNKFMFTNVVLPATTMGGFKIKTSYITCGPVGATCTEKPYIIELTSESAKEAKGQQWIPTYNNVEPNGGNILFGTSGVNPDDTKVHYVFRKYDANGGIKLEKSFTFDYQCLIIAKEVETSPGVFDYVFLANTINYKKSKAILAPANQYEYFRIDGTNFNVKENIKFTGVYTKMALDEVVEKDGALYLIGGCSNTATEHMGLYVMPKERKGFQVIKIKDGKVEYVKAIADKDAQAFVKVPDGLKGSAEVSFQYAWTKAKVVNGRICYEAQVMEDGKLGDLINMVFGQNGDMEVYLAKPWKETARCSSYFSQDGNTMYWLLEDYGEYNKIEGGSLIAKKARDVASAIGIVKYSLDTKTTAPFQNLVNEDWAMLYTQPLLYENNQEIVLNGIKLSKKAKESEAFFIIIKK